MLDKTIIENNFLSQERDSFRLWLQQHFTERCKKNPRYSLRAFAKSLDIDPSSLSQILSGKRNLSLKGIYGLCVKLSATPVDMNRFGLSQTSKNKDDDFFQVGIDTFTVISDWYHYAILELTFVADFQSDPKWIGKKLSISAEEAKIAIERLKRLELLKGDEGRLIKTSKLITNNGLINTSGAHKELQRQVISKALDAVDECQAKDKDITSMTMAIDVKNLDKARKLISKFRREMCELLEDGNQSQVYNLAVQLYPISISQEDV